MLRYMDMWVHYTGMMRDFGSHNILIIKYEDLKNQTYSYPSPNPTPKNQNIKISSPVQTRFQVLDMLAKFIYLPTTIERLNCSFLVDC